MIVYTGAFISQWENKAHTIRNADNCLASFARTPEQAIKNREALREVSRSPVTLIKVELERVP